MLCPPGQVGVFEEVGASLECPAEGFASTPLLDAGVISGQEDIRHGHAAESAGRVY